MPAISSVCTKQSPSIGNYNINFKDKKLTWTLICTQHQRTKMTMNYRKVVFIEFQNESKMDIKFVFLHTCNSMSLQKSLIFFYLHSFQLCQNNHNSYLQQTPVIPGKSRTSVEQYLSFCYDIAVQQDLKWNISLYV